MNFYPATGGKLSTLLDAGSGPAAAAGLDTFTTQVDQTPDSGRVDIGFHYKAPGSASSLLASC